MHCRDGGLQGGRVAHPDVLTRRDDDAAGDEARVLPRFEHPREVVQGGVDIGPPHRLDERRGDVVVLVPRSVVAHRSVGDGLLGVGEGDRHRAFGLRPQGYAVLRHSRSGLQCREGTPGIATAHADQVVASLVGEDELGSQPPLIGGRRVQNVGDLLVGE